MDTDSSKRILYLDLLRLLAILMMLQGHTIGTLLAQEYRNTESIFYSAWYFLRGFTAPLFMFTAGTVFTSLLTQNEFSFSKNTRIVKGLKRGISLVVIGYLLRYPTYSIFDFSQVTKDQWLTFFSIDALHIIGLGLILIICLFWLSTIFKINYSLFLLVSTILILASTPFILKLQWGELVSIPLASYFTKEFGSNFPLFPFMQYILLGALLGSLIKYNSQNYQKRLIFSLPLIGVSLIITSRIFFYISLDSLADSYSYSFTVLGGLLIVTWILTISSKYFSKVPESLLSLARNSLLIYIIHIIILYGSPWSIGLFHLMGKSFSTLFSVTAAIIMVILMALISLRIDKFKVKMFRNK